MREEVAGDLRKIPLGKVKGAKANVGFGSSFISSPWDSFEI
jgi:hypothetical protein